MIYEMRTYTLKPGAIPVFLELFEKEALPIIKKRSKLVAWWTTEIGPLNEMIHVWEYEDAAARESIRSAQNADPDLAAFRPKARDLIVSQQNRILVAAPFSPIR